MQIVVLCNFLMVTGAQFEPFHSRTKRCADSLCNEDSCGHWSECKWWLYDDLVALENSDSDGSGASSENYAYVGSRRNNQVTTEELSAYFQTRLNSDGTCRFGISATDTEYGMLGGCAHACTDCVPFFFLFFLSFSILILLSSVPTPDGDH